MLIKNLVLSICVIGFLFSSGFAVQVEAATVDDWLKSDELEKDEIDGEAPDGSESEQNETDSSIGSNGSLLFDLVKMVFALLLILALIYLLLKFLNKRNKLFQQVKALENLGGISVGQNKSVQIVRIGKNFYLIGVGENVEMLLEITDEELKKDLLNNDGDADNTGVLLTSIFQRKADGNKKNNSQSKSDFKNLFSSELEKLKQNRNKIIKQTQKEDEHE